MSVDNAFGICDKISRKILRIRLPDEPSVAISCGQQEGWFRGFGLTGSFGVAPPGEPFFWPFIFSPRKGDIGGLFLFMMVFRLFEFFDEVVDGAFDEGVVLGVVVHGFDFDGVGQFFLQGLPVGGVELGVVKFPSFGGVAAHAFERHEEKGVLGGVGKFLSDDFGDAALFLGIEAGNEDVW